MRTLTLAEREQLLRRIASRCRRDERGCLLWQLSTKNGYGQTFVDGQTLYTHRLIYELIVGPIPPGLQVLHSCDTPPCNEWTHLFAGTQRDNSLDMWRKGRGVRPPVHVGESHHLVTIPDVNVTQIRELYLGGRSLRRLARQFQCSPATIWRFANRVTRRDAPDDPNGLCLPVQLSLDEEDTA